jgi:hypothetical protein
VHAVVFVFFPVDTALRLGTEGYSPALLEKIVQQGGKTPSFREASENLKTLAGVEISPKQVERLTERLGREWAEKRDHDVELFKQDRLPRHYTQAPAAAAIMLDGGRMLTRSDQGRAGVHDPVWREPKYACCLSLESKRSLQDPQPEPPSKFLNVERVRKLVREIQDRTAPYRARNISTPKLVGKKRRHQHIQRPKFLVRTALATLARVEDFGYQVATEVYRRNLDQADFKACVCDGQAYNWKIWEMHLKPLGFIPVLDFLHLLTYLYSAAHASVKCPVAAWEKYTRWLRAAWAGDTALLLDQLQRDATRLGPVPEAASENDPRRIVQTALGYVRNNQERMNYPRYRLLGLPISSAPVESLIKQFNRRVKGSEKFWLESGGEAVLQIRAAYLSSDDRASRLWASARPYQRAVGRHRLAS